MKRTIYLVLTLIILATLFSSCSAATSKMTAPSSNQAERSSGDSVAPGIAPVAPGGSGANGAAGQPSAASPAASGAQASWDRMIIRNASLTLTVKDVNDSLQAVRDIATAAGGWAAQSSSRYEGERQVANVTIQVPATAFDATLSEIRKLAIKVETETSGTQDVTEEFTDLDSQVRNLQATEASLLKLMDKATRMEDTLAIQRELTNVRGQIEKAQGRMNFLKRRTDMSSIAISLLPQGAPKPTDRPVWKPLETAQKAWQASASFLQGFADILITLVIFLWWLIPVAAIVLYIRKQRPQKPSTPPA